MDGGSRENKKNCGTKTLNTHFYLTIQVHTFFGSIFEIHPIFSHYFSILDNFIKCIAILGIYYHISYTYRLIQ